MFKELDPLLHSQLRLSIMSLLMTVESADFSFLKEQTDATAGNLSVQLSKLEEAEYIEILKTFQGKKPHTSCSVTQKGRKAFQDYVKALQAIYQNLNKNNQIS